MNTIVIRLDGPLQSWGDASVFTYRASLDHPTKSGVIGIISAALGRDRDHDPTDLAACDFAVRIDQPGPLLTDYHTAGTSGWINCDGAVTTGEPKISEREYLQDAVFTAALTVADHILAEQIAEALQSPVWPLYLGRKSCPPSAPLYIHTDTTADTPFDALSTVAYQGHRKHPPATLIIVHSDPNGPETLTDQPVSYGNLTRSYLPRTVTRTPVPTPGLPQPALAEADEFAEANW